MGKQTPKPQVANLAYELVPIGMLQVHPRNPRQGDVGAIAESIKRLGFHGAVVAQKGTGIILAGSHRYMAAEALGLEMVPTVWVEADDEKALAILLADNRTSDLASYDEAALAEMLEEMARTGSLEGTGYDGDDVDDLLLKLNPPEGGPKTCPTCGQQWTE